MSDLTPILRFKEFTDNWTMHRLIDLSENGLFNGVFNDADKVGSGYRLINVKDMYLGEVIDIEKLTKLQLDEKEFLRNKVKYGDIFFTRSSIVPSGIAYSNVNLSYADDLTFDGHLMKLSPKKELADPTFLAATFKTWTLRKFFIARGKQSTMTTIGQNDISDIPVLLPQLIEQQKIADFLTAVDSKICQLTEKHRLLKEYKKGVMQQLFSQQIRFKDDNGKAFPDWNEDRLDSFIQRVNDPVGVEKTIEYRQIGIRCHGKGLFHKDKVTGAELGNKRVFWVHTKALIINIVFAWERAVAVTSESENGFVASHRFPMFVPIEGKSDLDYLLYFFLSPRGEYLLNLASPGGAGRNKTLGQAEFARLKLNLPSLAEQLKIAQFLQSIDKKIDAVAKQIEQTKLFKKGLLQQMFV
jgi:type I restriction enzyme S subunit